LKSFSNLRWYACVRVWGCESTGVVWMRRQVKRSSTSNLKVLHRSIRFQYQRNRQ
jgi:hypothetical protein